MGELTHFDKEGNAVMVDVSQKAETERTATAKGKIRVSREVFEKIQAGIMAAKRTWELVPLCHLLALTKCSVDFELYPESCEIEAACTVKTVGKTGVEIEALTGAQITLLTIYDMCKALDRSMVMTDIRLCEKSGGKSGEYRHD